MLFKTPDLLTQLCSTLQHVKDTSTLREDVQVLSLVCSKKIFSFFMQVHLPFSHTKKGFQVVTLKCFFLFHTASQRRTIMTTKVFSPQNMGILGGGGWGRKRIPSRTSLGEGRIPLPDRQVCRAQMAPLRYLSDVVGIFDQSVSILDRLSPSTSSETCTVLRSLLKRSRYQVHVMEGRPRSGEPERLGLFQIEPILGVVDTYSVPYSVWIAYNRICYQIRFGCTLN